MPGYIDPKTKKFVFVKEMVPEIIVPDLKNCEVKLICVYFKLSVNIRAFMSKKEFILKKYFSIN